MSIVPENLWATFMTQLSPVQSRAVHWLGIDKAEGASYNLSHRCSYNEHRVTFPRWMPFWRRLTR